jgi:hypothetical protein
MRDDPRTLRGTLTILGTFDETRFSKLDRYLGNVLTDQSARPLTSFLAWLETGTETSSLLLGLADSATGCLPEVPGRDRPAVVTAINTSLLMAAFVAGVQYALKTKDDPEGLRLTAKDREVASTTQMSAKFDLDKLYGCQAPERLAASASSSVSSRVGTFFETIASVMEFYASGTSFHDRIGGCLVSSPALRHESYRTYQEHYSKALSAYSIDLQGGDGA